MAKNVTLRDGSTQDPLYPITLLENVIDANGNSMQTAINSITYGNVGYSYNAANGTGAVTIDGRIPLHVITCTGNISSVTLSNNPPSGHSCHVIFTASTARTVAIAHHATNRKCPGAADLSLTVPANGYIEVDFLNINDVIYVRGVE